ncbi:MAG: hypothetical protein WCK40_07400 [Thermoleophilia bacterium]
MTLDAEALAELLRAALPDAEPFDLGPDELYELVAEVGGDPEAHAVIGEALVAWERMLA